MTGTVTGSGTQVATASVGNAAARAVHGWTRGAEVVVLGEPTGRVVEALADLDLVPTSTPEGGPVAAQLAALAGVLPGSADRPLVLVAGDLDIESPALLDLLDRPGVRTAALVADPLALVSADDAVTVARVGRDGRLLESVGTAAHRVGAPTHVLPGAVRIDGADRELAARPRARRPRPRGAGVGLGHHRHRHAGPGPRWAARPGVRPGPGPVAARRLPRRRGRGRRVGPAPARRLARGRRLLLDVCRAAALAPADRGGPAGGAGRPTSSPSSPCWPGSRLPAWSPPGGGGPGSSQPSSCCSPSWSTASTARSPASPAASARSVPSSTRWATGSRSTPCWRPSRPWPSARGAPAGRWRSRPWPSSRCATSRTTPTSTGSVTGDAADPTCCPWSEPDDSRSASARTTLPTAPAHGATRWCTGPRRSCTCRSPSATCSSRSPCSPAGRCSSCGRSSSPSRSPSCGPRAGAWSRCSLRRDRGWAVVPRPDHPRPPRRAARPRPAGDRRRRARTSPVRRGPPRRGAARRRRAVAAVGRATLGRPRPGRRRRAARRRRLAAAGAPPAGLAGCPPRCGWPRSSSSAWSCTTSWARCPPPPSPTSPPWPTTGTTSSTGCGTPASRHRAGWSSARWAPTAASS